MEIIEKIKYTSIILGIGALLYICYIGYSNLADKYCWKCTTQEYFDRGTDLMLMDDDKSRKRGLDFLETAAEKGHVEAQILLGELYLGTFPEGYFIYNKDKILALRKRVGVDRKKGVSYFSSLAGSLSSDQGKYSRMQCNLGLLYRTGILESKNKNEQAKKWFLMSAQRRNTNAMYELGMCYNSEGDYGTARQWFTKGFETGKEPGSAIMIGDYYFYGKGLRKDYNQSIKWYNQALDALAQPDSTILEKARKKLTQNASHRLEIAQKKAKETPQKQVVTVNYGLKGGVKAYSIYIPNLSGTLIGGVKNENGNIEAHIKKGILPDSDSMTSKVHSMSEGLHWVLSTYAKHALGTDKDFNFVMTR